MKRLTSLLGITLLLFCAFPHQTTAQEDPLTKGWEHFANNELDAALIQFKQAAQTQPEAHLGISQVYLARFQDDKFRQSVRDYYRAAQDPEIPMRALWTRAFSSTTEEDEEILIDISERFRGTLHHLAISSLRQYYFSNNQFKKAGKYAARFGTIDTWMVLGEFENISGSGFNKDYGALANPDANATFINKNGSPVRWFKMKGPRNDKWVDMERFFYASNSIVYAQNFCNSPVEQDVFFRLGVSGSVKVWVNDKLAFSEAEERNNGLDSYVFTAHLKKGYNRILIQLGESEAGYCNFMLRITDEAGQSISSLEFTDIPQGYSTETEFESEVVANPVIAHYSAAIDARPNDVGNYIILSQYYLYSDRVDEAKELLSRAHELFPNCTFIEVIQLLAYNRDDNSAKSSALVESIKLKDPDNILSLNVQFSEYIEQEKYAEAKEILADLEEVQGLSENVYEKKIELAGELDEMETLIGLIEEAYESYPEAYDFVYMKHLLAMRNNDSRRAIKYLRDYTDDHYSEQALTKLATVYLDQNTQAGFERGLDIYQDLLEINPVATGYYSRLAGLFNDIRMYEMSNQYLDECISIAPYISYYHRRKGENFAQLGMKKEAEAAYRYAIQLNPYDYDARHELRNLLKDDNIFNLFAERDNYKIYEESPGNEAFPEHSSVILNYEIKKVFYTGGGVEEKTDLLVKVLDVTGVDDWKYYTIPVYGNQSGNVDKAEVLKSDGTRVAAEQNGADIVFQNLEPGDAIHISYRLESHFSGKLANQIWGNHAFQYFIPVQHTSLQLLVPDSLSMHFSAVNGEIDMDTTDLDGEMRIYSWNAENVPGILYEPLMGPLTDVAPTLHYSSFPDWNFISDWYTDLAQNKAKTDYEVMLAHNDIFPEGYENLSDYEKARKIYDYIVGNVRYRSVSFLQSGLIPQEASVTLSAKQGDCKDVSVLFSALCSTVGLDADLVLVNTRDNGTEAMSLPSIDFNHCIAAVTLDSSDVPYYIELTSDKLSFATQSPSIQGAFTLTVPMHNDRSVDAGVLDIESGLPNNAYRRTSVRFNGGELHVDRESVLTGLLAAQLRNTYRDEGETQRRKYFQSSIQQEYTGAVLGDLEFSKGLADNSDSLVYTHTYTAPNVFTSISNLDIFRIPFCDGILKAPSYTSTTTRHFPVELWQFFEQEYYEDVVTIELPAGKTLSEVPGDVRITTPNIKYSLAFKKRGNNRLEATRTFEIVDDMVQPEDYTAFKEAIERIIKSDNQNIGLR